MKYTFIVEKGALGKNATVNLKTITVKNPIKIFHNFQFDKLISTGIVTIFQGTMVCVADIPDEYFETYPAVGFKVDADKQELVCIGLCDEANEDESIKQLKFI